MFDIHPFLHSRRTPKLETLEARAVPALYASAGFNDATGLNGSPTADSPYQLNSTVVGRGAGEPGWSTNWIRSTGFDGSSIVQSAITYEGDGALRVANNTNAILREWAPAQATGVLTVSQMIYIPPGGGFQQYIQGDGGNEAQATAAQWHAFPNGNFLVVDNGVYENTGIPVPVNTWTRVTLKIDLAARTYDFFVNGVRFQPPDPVDFRGNPSALFRVVYLLENPAGYYLDALQISSEPTAVADAYPVVEDMPLTVPAPGLLANDSDAGAPTQAELVSDPAHAAAFALNPDGSFDYTPAANYNGPDSFQYRLVTGSVVSAPATVTLTVSPVNDVPTASDGSVTTSEDTAVPVDLRPLASDVESPLVFTIVSPPTHGTLAPTATAGVYSYAPAGEYSGPDSFTYKVNDGTADSVVATVTLTVTAVNDPPVAANGSVTTAEDTPVTVDLRPLVSDVDNPPAGLSFVPDTQPANGALTPTGTPGVYTYIPSENFHGSDALTFRMNDGAADSNLATVSLTVTPVNDAPTAGPEAYTIPMADALTVSAAAGVLANDADTDGDALTAVLVTPPATGTLVLNPDGSFTFTPPAGFAGAVTFAYKATDGQADSPVQTVELTRDPFVRVNGRTLIIGGSAGPDTVRLLPAGGSGVVVELLTAGGISRQTYKPQPAATGFQVIEVNLAGGDDWFDSTALGRRVRVVGGLGADVIKTGNGADEVYGDAADGSGTGADNISTGGGNDSVAVGDGDNRIETGTGIDAVTVGDGTNAIYAGSGNDLVTAGSGRTFIDAGAGNDLVSAGAGDNWVLGGSGNDVLEGGSGADRLEGGTGNDLIAGGLGADLVLGGDGNDLLFDGSVAVKDPVKDSLAKVLAGFRPKSRTALDRLTDRLTIPPDAAGTDTLTGGAGTDWFWAGTGPEVTDVKAGELVNGVA